MRNFKFLATAIVAIMLSCVLAVASFAAITPFTDVDDEKNEALSDAVSLLSGLGVAKGTSETTFGTMEHVTREQMAAFVYRLFRPGKDVEGGSNSTPFTDLTDSTYFGYISWANGTGVIKGTSDTTFNPKGGIILQDAYTMLVRALGHETEDYIYPFTYIEKAEELGLDKDLDSVVNYTTKLTRGDVAVLLSNTFFADTSEVKKQKRVARTDFDLLQFYVVEKNVTVAEKIYDVNVGEFTVRATPKFAFNDSEADDTYEPLMYEDFGGDTLHLVANDDNAAIAEMFCDFAESGLTGKADDYIMAEVEVFYTLVEDEVSGDKVVDKIYFVNGAKQVLETNNVTGYLVDPKDESDYYEPHPNRVQYDKNKYEKVEGYVTVGNETIYFFDAPYSYIKPNYNLIDFEGIKEHYGDEASDIVNEVKYALRNANNIKLIDFKCLDYDDGTYSYYINSDRVGVNSAEDLVNNLQRIYSNGVYTMKFYDNNLDGIYDYAQYMPATYGFMDGDTDKFFATAMKGNAPVRVESKGSDIDAPFVPTIYYNGANLAGEKFNDGDFVVAYLNPEANLVHVISVVKPYNGYVSSVRYSSGLVKIDNQWFQTAYPYRLVENFGDGDLGQFTTLDGNKLTYEQFYNYPGVFYLKRTASRVNYQRLVDTENTAVGEVFNLYAYKLPGAYNQILWYDHIEDASMSFEMDELAIPVSNNKNAYETYSEFEFDDNIGEKVHYAKLYYNGKIGYLPLDTDDMRPSLGEGADDGKYNLALIEGWQNGYPMNWAYVDKICKVRVDENNHITLVPILHAEDDKGEYSGVSRDSSILFEEGNRQLYGNDLLYEAEGVIRKVAGSRYALLDVYDGSSLLGDFFGNSDETRRIKYFEMNGSTRIIIKNIIERDEENTNIIKDFEYLEFNASNFTGSTSADTPLTNIQYVLRANPDSTTKANLVLLYAEAENFEFDVKATDNSWRIVTDSYVLKDAEGLYRNNYRLFNPYTGTVEEDVTGDQYEDKASALDNAVANGVIIKIKNTRVNEDSRKFVGELIPDAAPNQGLVYVTEFDETFSYMGVVPVEALENEIANEDSAICCGEEFKAYAEMYTYDGNEANFDGEEFATVVDANENRIPDSKLFYEITDDTIITVINSKEFSKKALSYADYKLADAAALYENNKDYRCYDLGVRNKKGDLTTAYADYVKAYVYAEPVSYEDVIPEASLVIIVVNGDEERLFSDYDKNFMPKTHDKHIEG